MSQRQRGPERIPRKTHVNVIHRDGGGDIGHWRGWNSEEAGETATLAVGVEPGTCFRLVFSGDGPWDYDVSGSVEY